MSINTFGVTPPAQIDVLNTPGIPLGVATHDVSADAFINTHVQVPNLPSVSVISINGSAQNSTNVTGTLGSVSVSTFSATVIGEPEQVDTDVTASTGVLPISPKGASIGDSLLGWPEQSAVGYIPAVRNRNGAGVVSAGRGWGMDTRHAYELANIGSPTTGTIPNIIHVSTNSQLHDALDDEGAAIIVFDRGGNYQIAKTLVRSYKWLAGQTAPEQVWISHDENNTVAIKAGPNGHVFFQHVCLWNNGSLGVSPDKDGLEVNENTQNNGPWTHFVLDHCFVGGGVDGCSDITDDVNNICYIDSIIGRARGRTTHDHAAGSLVGNISADGLDLVCFIGTMYAHNTHRNVLSRCPTLAFCNFTIYNRERQSIQLAAKNASVGNYYCNIIGLHDKTGPSRTGVQPPISLRGSPNPVVPSSSEYHFTDSRADAAGSDDWDVVGANGQTNLRSNTLVPQAWPDGLVAAPNLALSTDDYEQLVSQNLGPRPNDRIPFIQTIIDDYLNGTGSISNDYSTPSISSPTITWDESGLSHNEVGSSGRSGYEDEILSQGEAFLV